MGLFKLEFGKEVNEKNSKIINEIFNKDIEPKLEEIYFDLLRTGETEIKLKDTAGRNAANINFESW